MSAAHSGFTCQDFVPNCSKAGGFFTKPVYEPFSALVVRANEWLRANRKWKVVTCESVEFKYRGDHMDFNQMTFFESGEFSTQYIRGLRLWLSELKENMDREQQIGYLNLVPQKVSDGGILTFPKFETLGEVLAKFNSSVRFNPLPGKIITIESQEMKITSSSQFDPDCSYWVERGNRPIQFVYIIRIFYEMMAGDTEEIGLQDFIPVKLASGGLFSFPKYEPFSALVNNVSIWCAQYSDLRICNIQTLEIKKTQGKEIDTQKMEYYESGSMRTNYIRILRVAYTRSSALYPKLDSMITDRLSCTSFLPAQIESGIFSSKYEDLPVIKDKISAWIKNTGAKILSVETIALLMHTGEENYGTEITYTYKIGDRNKHWIFVTRLYVYTP